MKEEYYSKIYNIYDKDQKLITDYIDIIEKRMLSRGFSNPY